MPYIPNGYGQANHRMRLSGDPDEMMVTLGIKFGPITGQGLDVAAEGLFDAWADAWQPAVTHHWALRGVTIYGHVGGQEYVTSSIAAERIGALVMDGLPQNCALLIKKRSNQGGRANRGRMYMPGLAETAVDHAGQLTAATITDRNERCAAWLTALNAVEGVDNAVILHVANIPEPTDITSMVVDTKIATQRRRLR